MSWDRLRPYRDQRDDLDGMLADLASQGIEPERPPYRIREGGGRICFVRDPDGYRVEIVERTEKRAPPA